MPKSDPTMSAAATARDVSLRDPMLKLALLGALADEGLRPLDWERLRREFPPELDDFERDDPDAEPDELDADYAFNANLARHLDAQGVSTAELARLTRLTWPDPNVQGGLWPQWDGEDETFDLTDLRGLEHCTGLEYLDLEGPIKNLKTVGALGNLRSLALLVPATDLKPLSHLTALTALRLSRTRARDLAPLAALPALATLTVSWDWDIGPEVRAANEPLVAALSARGVKVKVAWPKSTVPRAPRERPKPQVQVPPAPRPPTKAEQLAALGLEGATVTWQGEHLASACLTVDGGCSEKSFAALLASPLAARLTDLEVEANLCRSAKGVFRHLAAAPTPPPLERLAVRAAFWHRGAPLAADLGDASVLGAHYPRLQTLVLEGEPKLTGLALPALRALEVTSGALPKSVVTAVSQGTWSHLERLTLTFGALGPEHTPRSLAGLLAGASLPHLAHLALLQVDFLDVLAPLLVTSPLVKRLARLELSGAPIPTALRKALGTLGPEVTVRKA